MTISDPSLRGVAGALSRALVAVDFDGTLAPIVRDPSASRPVTGAIESLTALAAIGARVAVITGRQAEVVARLGRLERVPGLLVDGVYGAQRLRDGRLTVMATPPAMRAARAEVDAVLAAASPDPALWVEDKELSFVVHARRSDDPAAALAQILAPVAALADRHQLELHPGKQVLELRLPGIDKGAALRALLRELDPAALLWAGDDIGDLPAFQALREWRERTGRPAAGVAVSPAPSPDPLTSGPGSGDPYPDRVPPELADAADVTVTGPQGMTRLLTDLLHAFRASS